MSSDGNRNRFKSFFISDIIPGKETVLQQEMTVADSFCSIRSGSSNSERSDTSSAGKRAATDGKLTIPRYSSGVGVAGTSSEDARRNLFDNESPAEVCFLGRILQSVDNWSASMSPRSPRPSGQQAAAAAAAASAVATAAAAAAAAAAHFASFQSVNAHFASHHHPSVPRLLHQPNPTGRSSHNYVDIISKLICRLVTVDFDRTDLTLRGRG